MAVRLTRAEATAQTREQLLEAAERVFLERGFHAASLDAVAEEAGLTKGAVYSRFDSKADLFLAFLDERNAKMLETQKAWLESLESPDEVRNALRDWWAARLREAPD